MSLIIALAIAHITAPLAVNAEPQPGQHGEKNIVQIASELNEFSTVVAAVKAAGLAETLQGKGPFTLFAPTNKAFAALPEGAVDNLLLPENKAKLVKILTYHVIAGQVPASEVKTMKAKTVNGESLRIKVTKKGVTVDKAKVIKTDVFGTNGVIHVIDRVLMPKS